MIQQDSNLQAGRSNRPAWRKKLRQKHQRFQRPKKIESFLKLKPPDRIVLEAWIESFLKCRVV